MTVIPTEEAPEPLQSAKYFYDGDGKLVKSVVNSTLGNTTTTYFPGKHYSVEEKNGALKLQKHYAAGSTIIAVRTITAEADTLQWMISDQIGSISTTANADGSWNSDISYTAFGEIRLKRGVTASGYRYTSQLDMQSSIGLDYYVARFYDPQLARFVQADTMVPEPGKSIGFDRYAYVNNNPILYNDPSGHLAPLLVTAAVGAIVGFSIDILVQAVPQIAEGNYLNININWSEAAGATVAGAIAGGTLGIGTAVIAQGSLIGTEALMVSIVAGGLGNAGGNQAGALVQSSFETGDLAKASNYGYADPEKIAFDLTTGGIAGGFSYKAFGQPKIPKSIEPIYSLGKDIKYCPLPLVNKLGNPIIKPNYQVPLKPIVSYKAITGFWDYGQEFIFNRANSIFERNIRKLKKDG